MDTLSLHSNPPMNLGGSNSLGTVAGTEVKTETAAGRAWLEKYLHPPCERRAEYAGLCDRNNTAANHPEFRMEQNIQIASNGAPVPIFANNLLFISLPGLRHTHAVYQTSVVSGVPLPILQDTIQNVNFNLEQHLGSVANWRQPYGSTTFYLNATNFNNQGTVTVAKVKPGISNYPTAIFLEKIAKTQPELFHTLTKNRASLGDAIQVLNLGSSAVPFLGTELLELSRKATLRAAKDGAFVLKNFCTPTQQFTEMALGNTAAAGTPFPVQGISCFISLFDQALNTMVFLPISQASSPAIPIKDVPWDKNMTISFTLFEGLTVGGSNGNPYITVKTYLAAEFQAMINSILLPYQSSPTVEDEIALKLAFGMMMMMEDSMPASANDLGSILATAAKYVPAAIEWIGGLFGKKEKKTEGQKDVSAIVTQLAKMLTQTNMNTNAQMAKIAAQTQQIVNNAAKVSREETVGPNGRRKAGNANTARLMAIQAPKAARKRKPKRTVSVA